MSKTDLVISALLPHLQRPLRPSIVARYEPITFVFKMLSFLQQTLQVLLLAILLRPVHAIIKFDQATCGVSPGSNPILDDVVNMANAAIVRLLLRLSSVQPHLAY